jgi:release factor glutamine methyltransferase
MRERPQRLGALLRWAAGELAQSPTATLDARVLMKAALDCDDAALIAEPERLLSETEAARFDAMIERRRREEPVAHIVGRREFWSLDIAVEPGILAPRPESETLIEAVTRRRRPSAPLEILDLGCGSGALLCALLSAFPAASGLGVDIDPAAAALTSRNLERLGLAGRGRARVGDWFAGETARYDVIIANPPYIPAPDRAQLAREVRDYENAHALFAGSDGLDALRRIIAAAPLRLAPAGLLTVEFGAGQAELVKELARRAFPHREPAIDSDLGGRPRALVIDLAPSGD